jgi:hypothetical protein
MHFSIFARGWVGRIRCGGTCRPLMVRPFAMAVGERIRMALMQESNFSINLERQPETPQRCESKCSSASCDTVELLPVADGALPIFGVVRLWLLSN